MDVRGIGLLEDFRKAHADVGGPLMKWLEIVRAVQWTNYVDCRRTFPTADQVKVKGGVVTVFNIKGNNYRLVAAVSYPMGLVVVRRLMTHAEYSKDRWKDQM